MKTPAQTAKQQPNTGALTHLSTREVLPPIKRRGHRLTGADAEAIAALVAKRLSEAEACAVLAIPSSTWKHWKARPKNAERYAEVFDRIRGEKIRSHMANIEAASTRDWRASECYLEKAIPDRFAKRAAVEVNAAPPPFNEQIMWDALRLVYGETATDKVETTPVPKQLLDAEIEPKCVHTN